MFPVSFIFSYLILHRLIWGIKFFLGFSYWTHYVNLKPTANAGKRDAIKTYVDIALYTIDSTPWGSPTAINTAFSSGQWSSNFFNYFLPVSGLFFLPLPTLVYFSPKIFFSCRALYPIWISTLKRLETFRNGSLISRH